MPDDRFATPDDRFTIAAERLEALHRQDPRTERTPDGEERPHSVVYHHRMAAWLDRIEPGASAALRLAARAQHVHRWKIPRDHYPRDRRGYLQWRHACKRLHADVAAGVMAEAGYDEATIARVRHLLLKRQLKSDPETQTLEDVVCLVFLESYLADFAADYGRRADDAKMLGILRKTWAKMSARGRREALGLELEGKVAELVERALNAG